MSRAGIVLCGGRSSRMGRAKAWLPWFGRSMIEHVVGCLRPLVSEIVVVGSADLLLPDLPARIVSDRAVGLGPLAGIREGLAAIESDWAFVTSVDAPHLSPEYVDELFAVGKSVAPVAEGHVQVLSAIYPREAGERADALLAAGIRRPLALLEAVGYLALDSTIAAGSRAWSGFNTPREYLEAVRSIEPDASAEIEFLGRSAALARGRNSPIGVPVGTLDEIFAMLPEAGSLLADGRVRKPYLVSVAGRELVRDLRVPVGPGERVSVIDAMVGG